MFKFDIIIEKRTYFRYYDMYVKKKKNINTHLCKNNYLKDITKQSLFSIRKDVN